MQATIRVLAAWIACGLCAGAARADGDGMVRSEVIVPAGAQEVWQAFTTRKGVESWMVPKCMVDFRLGGTLQTTYDPNVELGTEGAPGVITHRILAYAPQRFIAFKTTPPADAADFIKLACAGWWAVEFEALAPDRTRVVVMSLGYETGPDWETTREHFERGNAWTLDRLRKKFTTPEESERTARAWELTGRLAGGEWIAEAAPPDGAPPESPRMRGRVRATADLVGRYVLAEGWLGDSRGMRPHAHMIYYRDSATQQVRFQDFGEGGVSSGAVRSPAPDVLAYDWRLVAADGRVATLHVEMRFRGADAYDLRMFEDAAAAARGDAPKIELNYRRVSETPPEFLTPASPAAGRS